MNDPRLLRKARQTLSTDRLLGLDFVPLSGRFAGLGESDTITAAPAQAPVVTPVIVTQVPQRPLRTVSGRMPPPVPPHRRDTPVTPVSMSRQEKLAALKDLEDELTQFIHNGWPRDGWNKVVFGEGDPDAQIMFIGEGPGSEEDLQGRPFVGPAGKLLDKQIIAMGLTRQAVYIANIAKTRPPGNRVPNPEEAELWLPWLDRQVQIICPRVIVALGATASKYLLGDPKLAITRVRGQWCTCRGVDLMPTFHPAYLLRQYTVENRRRVWNDLQKVLEKLGLQPPSPGKTLPRAAGGFMPE